MVGNRTSEIRKRNTGGLPRAEPDQSISPLIPLYVPMPGNPEEGDLERAAVGHKGYVTIGARISLQPSADFQYRNYFRLEYTGETWETIKLGYTVCF